MLKERGNAVSRLNHSSSPSDVASSTQPKFVMEGLARWLKAQAILDARSGCRQGQTSLVLAPV